MGYHNSECKRQYRKRKRQMKREKKRELKKLKNLCDSCSQSASHKPQTCICNSSSGDQQSSRSSPFECTSSCCLSDVPMQKPEKSSSSGSLIKTLKALKSTKTTAGISGELYRDPLYVKWQEYKLLTKRMKTIESETFSK